MRIKATLIALAIAALCVSLQANSLLLDATTKSLEMQTSAAGSVDYIVSYADITSSAFTAGMSQGNATTATTTTILAAPGASTQRQIKWVSIRNRSTTAANAITIKLDVSGTEYHVGPAVTLGAGEALRMDADGGLTLFNANGTVRTTAIDATGISGETYAFQKTGTAKDAAGYWIAYAKDAGFPGAFSVGAPGLAGFNTDCSISSQATNPIGAAQVGSHKLDDPASGSLYLTNVSLADSVAEVLQLVDPLWINTGAVVTTTTAQTITMPGALPARSADGTSNGDGVFAALLVKTATTNAGAIANTTISYTDSDGNAGNTGTFSALAGWQAPATPVIGTWMPFQLAAGDRGIRSVESITLGTSYAAGALSLVLYRVLATIPNPVANVGGIMSGGNFFAQPGVRLYNDTCVWAISVGSASAGTLAGSYTITER